MCTVLEGVPLPPSRLSPHTPWARGDGAPLATARATPTPTPPAPALPQRVPNRRDEADARRGGSGAAVTLAEVPTARLPTQASACKPPVAAHRASAVGGRKAPTAMESQSQPVRREGQQHHQPDAGAHSGHTRTQQDQRCSTTGKQPSAVARPTQPEHGVQRQGAPVTRGNVPQRGPGNPGRAVVRDVTPVPKAASQPHGQGNTAHERTWSGSQAGQGRYLNNLSGATGVGSSDGLPGAAPPADSGAGGHQAPQPMASRGRGSYSRVQTAGVRTWNHRAPRSSDAAPALVPSASAARQRRHPSVHNAQGRDAQRGGAPGRRSHDAHGYAHVGAKTSQSVSSGAGAGAGPRGALAPTPQPTPAVLCPICQRDMTRWVATSRRLVRGLRLWCHVVCVERAST